MLDEDLRRIFPFLPSSIASLEMQSPAALAGPSTAPGAGVRRRTAVVGRIFHVNRFRQRFRNAWQRTERYAEADDPMKRIVRMGSPAGACQFQMH
ncbi:hypothetical protein [Sphingomonas faeni]|uniref:hypothetical protein n=1 Tax=Sphingomonas faeni TaxID=185950 RepID=UPI003349FFC3